MVAKFKFVQDEMGRKVCSVKMKMCRADSSKKKDYSNIEKKVKDLHLIQYIEKA